MITKIILIVLGFGITVFIHELGHYIMARWAGVRVEVFSIGFGPKILTFMERGGTKYILSLIPLGGYIKMLGQEDLPSKQKKPVTEDHYLAKTPLQRMGIICAGVIMNSILAYILMISALWIGIDFIAPEVGKVEVGSPAAQEGAFESGDIIKEMNGKPLYTFIDIRTNVALAGENADFDFVVDRNGREEAIKVTSKKSEKHNTPRGLPPMAQLGIAPALSSVVSSIDTDSDVYKKGIKPGMKILSVRIDGVEAIIRKPERMYYMIGINPEKTIDIEYEDGNGDVRTVSSKISSKYYSGFMTTPVVGVIPGGPADKGGLQTGDIVLMIYGRTMNGWYDVLDVSGEIPPGADEVKVQVKRGDEQHVFPIKPYFCKAEGRSMLGLYYPISVKEYKDLTRTIYYIEPEIQEQGKLQVGDIFKDITRKDNGNGKEIVVTFTRDGEKSSVSYEALTGKTGYLFWFDRKRTKLRKGFFGAFGYSFVRYIDELKRIYIFLGRLVTGKMSPKMIGGPVQIANITYKVADFGIGYFLYLFSLIGLSLAVINILPIPVLDGGILVFLIYEMIRGKPASEKFQLVAQYVGLGLLLFLILFVTYNDIMRLILQ
ncbi:RIP metalloprotease RseP [Planctomycetota bacterium]